MNNPEQQAPDNQEAWPRHLNKLLIGIGVIAFGLIIADRLANVFQVDDVPEFADAKNPVETETDSSESVALVPDSVEDDLLSTNESDSESVLGLATVFGSRVVFVSASEPMYVVTEDDKRFDVGSPVETGMTFAGATQQQIILNDNGNLIVIGLPEPEMQ